MATLPLRIIQDACTRAWSRGLTFSSLSAISGVLPRDLLRFRVTPLLSRTGSDDSGSDDPSDSTMRNSSSLSPSSTRSAHDLPAWRANTPVRATLQIRLFDASSRVAIRRELGVESRRS